MRVRGENSLRSRGWVAVQGILRLRNVFRHRERYFSAQDDNATSGLQIYSG
jgi:hypothetical protein